LTPAAFAAIETPLHAVFCFAATDEGLAWSAFARSESAGRREAGALFAIEPRGNAIVREARRQVRAYFAKRLRTFDLPLVLEGTPLQVAAWRLVASTEWGMLLAYADVANAIGRPGAHRGVAAAMGRSPLALFIPAHRVIGANGTLRGADPRDSMRGRLLRFEGHRVRAERARTRP